MSNSRTATTRPPAWMLQPDRVVAPLDELCAIPSPRQHLERPRLDGERARLVYAVELPVDDPDGSAERVQLGGERQPGRTGADDEHVRLAVWSHG